MVERRRPKGGAAPPKNSSSDNHEAVALGRAAWARRKADCPESWADWMVIGAALLIGKHEVMRTARVNKPRGKKYTTAYSQWLQLHGFDEIDKSDRSKLILIVEQREKFEAWRAELPEKDRLKLNAPSSVWRVSRCKQRGFSEFRCAVSPKKTRSRGLSAEPVLDELARWIITANDQAQLARNYRSYDGPNSKALVAAIRDAASEWAKTLDDFKAQLDDSDQHEPAEEQPGFDAPDTEPTLELEMA